MLKENFRGNLLTGDYFNTWPNTKSPNVLKVNRQKFEFQKGRKTNKGPKEDFH